MVGAQAGVRGLVWKEAGDGDARRGLRLALGLGKAAAVGKGAAVAQVGQARHLAGNG